MPFALRAVISSFPAVKPLTTNEHEYTRIKERSRRSSSFL
jgi:hypothetical protein